jgi:hypothetical protein
MSLSVAPVPVLVTDDPRVDLNVSPYYLVERSAGEIIYRNYEADSFSGGTINITTNISDRRTVVASKVHLKVKFRVTATAAVSGGNAYEPFTAGNFDIITQTQNSQVCPRFSPFMSACTNCIVNINGKQMSQPVGRYFTPLMKYSTIDENTYDFSTFPSHQDTFQEFYTYVVPVAGNPLANVDSNDATLYSAIGAGYVDSDPYVPSARLGWFQNVARVVQTPTNPPADPTVTVCAFEYETEEIVPVSPLIWGHREIKGLSGIDTLNLYLNYDQRLLNASMNATGQNTAAANNQRDRASMSFNVEIIGASAEFIYFSPRPNVEVPEVLRYRYDTFQHQPKNIPASAENSGPYSLAIKNGAVGNSQFTSDAITLQGMPKRMYIFIKRQYNDINQYTPDTYARITNINLQLGNKPGILAEAQPQVLYRMAVKNGYKGTWDNWFNTQGSVVCLDFSEDIPLGTLDAPGTLSKMNMQYTVRYDNLYYDRTRGGAANANVYATNNLELNTVIIYEGMIVIKNGQVIEESSVVSPLDVASQNKVRNIHIDDLIDYGGGSYSGGKFPPYLSGVKKGLTKVKELAQKAAPYVEKYGPMVASAAAKAIPVITGLLAAGYTENEIYALMEKGDVKGKKGGARMPKSSLKARAIKNC